MTVWSCDLRFTADDEETANKITEGIFKGLAQIIGNVIIDGPYEVVPVERVLAKLEEDE